MHNNCLLIEKEIPRSWLWWATCFHAGEICKRIIDNWANGMKIYLQGSVEL